MFDWGGQGQSFKSISGQWYVYTFSQLAKQLLQFGEVVTTRYQVPTLKLLTSLNSTQKKKNPPINILQLQYP